MHDGNLCGDDEECGTWNQSVCRIFVYICILNYMYTIIYIHNHQIVGMRFLVWPLFFWYSPVTWNTYKHLRGDGCESPKQHRQAFRRLVLPQVPSLDLLNLLSIWHPSKGKCWWPSSSCWEHLGKWTLLAVMFGSKTQKDCSKEWKMKHNIYI